MVGLAFHHSGFLESILAPLISEPRHPSLLHNPHALRVVCLSRSPPPLTRRGRVTSCSRGTEVTSPYTLNNALQARCSGTNQTTASAGRV